MLLYFLSDSSSDLNGLFYHLQLMKKITNTNEKLTIQCKRKPFFFRPEDKTKFVLQKTANKMIFVCVDFLYKQNMKLNVILCQSDKNGNDITQGMKWPFNLF